MSFSNTMPIAATRTIIRTPSAQAWFAGGERVGYDPKARAVVAAQGAPTVPFAWCRASECRTGPATFRSEQFWRSTAGHVTTLQPKPYIRRAQPPINSCLR